ncbi:ATP-binding protein [Streptomyces sp. NPDC018019]|uniref:ATP-binding protein n=1 Tax=Streptomyces sp. NPDC018019 TaxID=3365030 RepID=UPI00379D75C5
MNDTETLSTPAPVTAPATAPVTAGMTAVVEGADASGVRDARRAAQAFAEQLHPVRDPALADTLVLVVCELVTNALRHGGGRYRLELSAAPGSVTVSVSDPSPVRPRERTPDLNGESGGFGWPMIRLLTRHITITSGPGGGKTIRARLSR